MSPLATRVFAPRLVVLLSLILFAVLARTALAAQNMTELSRGGDGYAYELAASGTLGYMAAADRLEIVDLSSPSRPARVGSVPIPGEAWNPVQGVAVRAGTLYLARGDQGLQVYDLTDPLAPALVAEVQDGSARRLVRRLARLYVGGDDGLLIYALSSAQTPSLIGSWSEPGVGVTDVEIVGNTAYLATAEWDYDVQVSRLVALDISNPVAPALLGRWNPQTCCSPVGRVAPRVLLSTWRTMRRCSWSTCCFPRPPSPWAASAPTAP